MNIVGIALLPLIATQLGWSSRGLTDEIRNFDKVIEARVASASSCPREGHARIRLGKHLFFVPRVLLIQVDNEKGAADESWRCSDTEINARSLFIDVRTTHAGDQFYKDWIERKKLPRSVHLAVKGEFKNFLDQRFQSFIEKGAPVKTAENGLRYVEFPGQTYYDASTIGLRGYGGQPIVFQCSPRFLKDNARVCSTYYHFDESIDLRYRFLDPPFVAEDWLMLDARTRQLVLELLEPKSK